MVASEIVLAECRKQQMVASLNYNETQKQKFRSIRIKLDTPGTVKVLLIGRQMAKTYHKAIYSCLRRFTVKQYNFV